MKTLNEYFAGKKKDPELAKAYEEIHEITKEDWDKVFECSPERIEQEFNVLIDKYIQTRPVKFNSSQGFFARRKIQRKRNLIIEVLKQDCWISNMRIYGQSYVKFEELIKRKYVSVTHMLEEFGMISDYYKFYGNGPEQKLRYIELYSSISMIQDEKMGLHNTTKRELIEIIKNVENEAEYRLSKLKEYGRITEEEYEKKKNGLNW